MLKLIPCLIAALLLAAAPAHGQGGRLSLIRDAEIEDTIRSYATPLFQAAGLEPDAVQVLVVNDKRLNAFVAGGQRLFINYGLLIASDSPAQVSGVIAHETGHIAGGHLSRVQDALRNASTQSIIAALLGAAVAIGGGGGAGFAVAAGGQAYALSQLLRYSRQQESSADQAAVTYLDQTGQSARGLIEFLGRLGNQELLASERQDPYVRTHPLTRERIEALQTRASASRFYNAAEDADQRARHTRMVAKLRGFLDPPRAVLSRYAANDTSPAARMARAVATFRLADLDEALRLIDALIAEAPDDPYFLELKGQFLHESGRGRDSIAPYSLAVEKLPGASLLRSELAAALIELNDPAENQRALTHLAAALRSDEDDPNAWRLYAIALGRDQQFGLSALASAEQAIRTDHGEDARRFAQRAVDLLPAGSPGALRALDIQGVAERRRKR